MTGRNVCQIYIILAPTTLKWRLTCGVKRALWSFCIWWTKLNLDKKGKKWNLDRWKGHPPRLAPTIGIPKHSSNKSATSHLCGTHIEYLATCGGPIYFHLVISYRLSPHMKIIAPTSPKWWSCDTFSSTQHCWFL